MTTTIPSTKDLLGGGALSVKFEAPGDTVEGTLIKWDVKPVTKMGTNEIDTFPSGDPKYQFILTLQTNMRDDVDDDGKRTLYCKSHLFVAVKQAVAATGAEDFEKGAYIKVVHTHLGEAQRGFSAPKMFSVDYKRPSAQMISGDQAQQNVAAGLGGQPVQDQYVPQQQAQPTQAAPQQPAVKPTHEIIAALISAGVDPATAAAIAAQQSQG